MTPEAALNSSLNDFNMIVKSIVQGLHDVLFIGTQSHYPNIYTFKTCWT